MTSSAVIRRIHYVLVDDKVAHPHRREAPLGPAPHHGIPAARALRARARTWATYPKPDITIERIGEFTNLALPALLAAAKSGRPRRAPPQISLRSVAV